MLLYKTAFDLNQIDTSHTDRQCVKLDVNQPH